MTLPIVTAIVARNEADRYLKRVLERCARFSDTILLLDDQSSDGTRDVAKRQGARVRVRGKTEHLWGAEAPARAELWDWAAAEAKGSWVLICDADMLLEGDPGPYTASWDVNAWSFVLYDLWDSETTYRADNFWRGHEFPRPWLFRPSLVPRGWRPLWQNRGLHSGHCPTNFPLVSGWAPDLYWLHLGWLREADRLAKHAQYQAAAEHLSPFEQAHVNSITD